MRLSRLFATAAVVALAAGASQAQAQDLPVTFSGSATVTSDYIFRGVSQTDGSPAIQGSLEVGHESGAFAGVWASNVDFGDEFDADAEVDLYLGYANEVAGFSYAATALYYMYPEESDSNYLEFALTGGYTIDYMTFNVGAYWSPDYGVDQGDAWYLTYGVEVAATDAISFYYNLGWNGFEQGENYLDYNVGMAIAVDFTTIDIRYTDTDIVGDRNADQKVVVSFSFGF